MSLTNPALTDVNDTLIGTSGPDVLRGTKSSERIHGEGGDDRLYGNGGNDRLYGDGGDDLIDGGLGHDALEGGAGADTFVYSDITQSYQGGGHSYSDLILDFSSEDRLDVSALGFTGLGDGQDHTLSVEVNDAGTRTYLKSYADDEGGNRFQLAFDGDVSQYLTQERVIGNGGDDVIRSGPGAEALRGGAGADTFVYTSIDQSYEGGGRSHSDLILDFTAEDRIDVSALGFTGLGDGHNRTLSVDVNDAGTRTYLRSDAYDEVGNRFQLAFEGDVSQYLTQEQVIGNGGGDVVNSGPGGDALRGGEGADTFLYDKLNDSFQIYGLSFSDRIQDFSSEDRIDVSTLGFTGLGNGHDHTLKLEIDDAGTHTYLKSYDPSEDGSRFQVSFDGDVSQFLDANSIIFASTVPATSAGQATVSSTAHEAVAVELQGVPLHDPSGIA
jgi:Ca2+-binding RTX toxin-like protein